MGEKPVLTYRVERQRSAGGFYKDHIHISECCEVLAADRLAATIDNKAGYQSADVAARMGRMYACMQQDGHPVFYDGGPSCHYFSIAFQLYLLGGASLPAEGEPVDYCGASFDWPRDYGPSKWAFALAERIGKKIEKKKEYPGEVRESTFEFGTVIAALESMRAVRAEIWRESGVPYPNVYKVPTDRSVKESLQIVATY